VNGHEPHNLKFFLAGRRGDVDFVPHLAIEQSAADRGGGRDEPLFDIGFLAATSLYSTSTLRCTSTTTTREP